MVDGLQLHPTPKAGDCGPLPGCVPRVHALLKQVAAKENELIVQNEVEARQSCCCAFQGLPDTKEAMDCVDHDVRRAQLISQACRLQTRKGAHGHRARVRALPSNF